MDPIILATMQVTINDSKQHAITLKGETVEQVADAVREQVLSALKYNSHVTSVTFTPLPLWNVVDCARR